ncbi:MAG TPA: chorismate-binding protein, partial [Thermoleophilaceae bacterium]|nr:chorismate-binding protein [Thermoleophilaceae bacterium]
LAPDRGAFVGGPGGTAVASLSPELFLERRGRRVRTAPIKGTRPRSADAAELEGSAKDRAENTMIVDLMRNDLGRVCEPGSVTVDALARARPHAGVWHLVSEVSGDLRADAGDADLLRACVPPGSVTGAPKIAAQNVIAEVESTGREAYTGAIGFASPAAGLELSVAIRTFEFSGPRAWLGVGGGVVADSDPAAEARECAVKAAPLLAAIGARSTFDPPGDPNMPRVARRGPTPTPRPDPEAGVFSTLLVRDGLAIAAAGHLARLGASVAELYGAELPADLADRIETAAAAHPGPGRLRVTYAPGDAEPATIVVKPFDPDRPPATLAPVTVPGGIGAHKWADRRLLDALAEEAAPALPLLVDLDGYVLESWGANVFARLPGGTLATPPLDGRILPGVARAQLLKVHTGAAERRLTLDEVLAAEEVFLTSALGVQVAEIAPEPTSASTSTPSPTR